MSESDVHALFKNPPREFGAGVFWFWNDDLSEAELLRQLQAFYDKGIAGVIMHGRVGLSRRVGYLTDEWFRLCKVVTERARQFGMKIILYDEGAYPSGSACGQVVAENPEFAARCLIPLEKTVVGPQVGYWRPNPGRALMDRLVCVVQARELADGKVDPDTLTELVPDERGLVRFDVPDDRWKLLAVWNVVAGGSIRGVFEDHEDAHATAPPAGDLMNPDAVACFLRLTHDRYWQHLRDYFGTTIVAMFTDEPNALGRGARRGPSPYPYTEGFLADVQKYWSRDPRRWLPALWLDCGPETDLLRARYLRAVQDRIGEVFFGSQRQWCERHGIALTGHAAESNELEAARYFHWPGQDIVWRYIEPGKPSAVEGPHSLTGKTASSPAAVADAPRTLTEVAGAYGWRLSLDELKWLIDWHAVRGVNLFILHAFFYSLRGRRAYESEPDLGIHNVWWPYFGLIGDYIRRLSWLFSDGRPVYPVAVLTDPHHVSWTTAKVLTQHQIDFFFVTPKDLELARIEGDVLVLGNQHVQAVVCDPPGPCSLRPIQQFRAAGGLLLETWSPKELPSQLARRVVRDVDWPDQPDLRAFHYRKDDRDYYFMVNEGETAIQGRLSLAVEGHLERWDPLTGAVEPWPGEIRDRRTYTALTLERRQGLVLAVHPEPIGTKPFTPQPTPGKNLRTLEGPWQVMDTCGKPAGVPGLGDWAKIRDYETFSGTLVYTTQFSITPTETERAVFLDLGRVGEIAEVILNDAPLGVRAWAPYVFDLRDRLHPGQNTLQIKVTNSMANAYDGLQLPSGLIGPVAVREVGGNS